VRTIVEKGFMDLVLYRDIRPGQQINTLDLARQFSVSASAVREYLTDFSRCGLLERRPNSSWTFRGFDVSFARELSHVRELFEVDSAVRFAELPLDDPLWQELAQIEADHITLLGNIDDEYTKFSRLDDVFHEFIMSVSSNRFMESFHDLLRMVFHYHYQWTKITEKQRNIVAIQEHLAYVAALRSRDRDAIRAAALAHLRTARRSLIESIERDADRTPPTGWSGRSSI
jgi:DNA-binding GntR family transcriptional regulator